MSFVLPFALQVREVLEGYLDDDQDMKDMNLTAKEQHALHQEMEAQVRSRESMGFYDNFCYGQGCCDVVQHGFCYLLLLL